MVHDPSPTVRVSAIRAVLSREYNEVTLMALVVAAKTDAEVSVRSAALGGLSQYARDSEAARGALEWSSINEADETLRAAATHTLRNLSEES